MTQPKRPSSGLSDLCPGSGGSPPRRRGSWPLLAMSASMSSDAAPAGVAVSRPMEDVRETVLTDPAAEMALTDLLGHLHPERRAAFVLTQVVGLSYAEAAKVCHCPVGTIRSRLARARSELVAMFAQANKDSQPGRPSPA
jgi:DNA-directed RNA polymerase specialized sigma24 family protein